MPLLIFVLAAVIVLIDQLLKYLAVTFLQPAGSVEVIPNLFSLTYVENRGAAFGMLADMRWVFIVFTVLVILALAWIVIRRRPQSKLFFASAVLLIGGGIGNLIDRIWLGYVIDYLSLSFFSPVCNFADYCITAGTVLLVIYLLFYSDFLKKDQKVKHD